MEKSLLACFLLALVLLGIRIGHSPKMDDSEFMVTDWDALGYYMYAPSIIIYNDVTKLEWMDEMDAKYNLTGGNLYQSQKAKNGNYVNKYLGGISIMQLPFFLTAHAYTKATGGEADGFSQPYQVAAALSGLIYCILAFFILRLVLRQYFSDEITAISLLLVGLATNFIQYVSISGTMSHSYIFFLYAVVLYATMKWHANPKLKWAALTGGVIGLATICRPTEAIMLFIPLLWGMQNKAASKEKWALVKAHKTHIYAILVCGLIGILPQLIYWKMTAGTFIHNVGSKWSFLLPFFQVLAGFRKGWFIYTPITIFFVWGLFYIRKYTFHKSVIVFSLINIWIIISWWDWNYGASYSARALVQSYAVWALALAGFLTWLQDKGKWKWGFAVLAAYLTAVNLFQLWQYNNNIIHFEKMTRQLYARVYLDPQPSALDFSLLYTDEILSSTEGYAKIPLANESGIDFEMVPWQKHFFVGSGEQGQIVAGAGPAGSDRWLHVDGKLFVNEGLIGSNFECRIQEGDSVKNFRIRLDIPFNKDGQSNPIEFFMKVPEQFQQPQVKAFMEGGSDFKGRIESVKIEFLTKE